MRRCRGFVVLWAALIVGLLPGVALAETPAPLDPALTEGLRAADVFLSPHVLGTEADAAERLSAQAELLAGRKQPVKLALVRPFGAEDVFVYAERLREAIDWDGTLVVTTATGPTGAAGPRTRDSIAAAFLAERIDLTRNPVRRLVAASEIAVPPPPRGDSGIRGLFVLIGLAMFGGAWAIGWGLRREQRRARAAFSETRAALRVNLDALGARLAWLHARDPLPEEARPPIEVAAVDYTAAEGVLARAVTQADLDAGIAHLHDGLAALEQAGRIVGEPLPADDPFAGLCAADPAHGAAVTTARLADREQPVPVCVDCRAAADAGRPTARRLIPVAGEPLPFDEVPLTAPGDDEA